MEDCHLERLSLRLEVSMSEVVVAQQRCHLEKLLLDRGPSLRQVVI